MDLTSLSGFSPFSLQHCPTLLLRTPVTDTTRFVPYLSFVHAFFRWSLRESNEQTRAELQKYDDDLDRGHEIWR